MAGHYYIEGEAVKKGARKWRCRESGCPAHVWWVEAEGRLAEGQRVPHPKAHRHTQ